MTLLCRPEIPARFARAFTGPGNARTSNHRGQALPLFRPRHGGSPQPRARTPPPSPGVARPCCPPPTKPEARPFPSPPPTSFPSSFQPHAPPFPLDPSTSSSLSLSDSSSRPASSTNPTILYHFEFACLSLPFSPAPLTPLLFLSSRIALSPLPPAWRTGVKRKPSQFGFGQIPPSPPSPSTPSHFSPRLRPTFSPWLLPPPAPAPLAFAYRRGPICSCSQPSLSAPPVLTGRPLRPCLLFRPSPPPAPVCGSTLCGLPTPRHPPPWMPWSTSPHFSRWSFSSEFPNSSVSAPPISLPHTCASLLRSTPVPKSGVCFQPPCCPLPPTSHNFFHSTPYSTPRVLSFTPVRSPPFPIIRHSTGIPSAGQEPSPSFALGQPSPPLPCGDAG